MLYYIGTVLNLLIFTSECIYVFTHKYICYKPSIYIIYIYMLSLYRIHTPSVCVCVCVCVCCSLFSCWVVSTLRSHGLQHVMLLCSLLTPRVCSNWCPLSWWCSTISSSVIPFSSCPQSFPAPRSFPVCWLFASGGQSFGASTSASVLSMNI